MVLGHQKGRGEKRQKSFAEMYVFIISVEDALGCSSRKRRFLTVAVL